VTITNPAGAGAQRVNAVAARIGATETAIWKKVVAGELDCTADDFTVTPVVPSGTHDFGDDLYETESWVGTFSVSMDNEPHDQDACKSVTDIPLFVKAS
jgi:hypothetical protein